MNKKLLLVLALITGSIAFEAAAQVHINVNIGVRPAWCPVGYEQAAYYYMPDIDAYYDVPQRQFIYLQGGDWVFAGALPGRYRNYDLYHCNKIMVNEPRPYLRNDFYRRRYAGYRGHPNERFMSGTIGEDTMAMTDINNKDYLSLYKRSIFTIEN
jgi:hypothetical protein